MVTLLPYNRAIRVRIPLLQKEKMNSGLGQAQTGPCEEYVSQRSQTKEREKESESKKEIDSKKEREKERDGEIE